MPILICISQIFLDNNDTTIIASTNASVRLNSVPKMWTPFHLQ